MVGILFDTNIYGFIATESPEVIEKLTKAILEDNSFVIHNFAVIRKELRKAPKILPLYDKLVCSTIVSVSEIIEKIANEYYQEYIKLGGSRHNDENFMNDLRIVACASVKNFNLIYPDDKNSMCGDFSIQVYKNVNLKYSYRTPTFYSYADIKRKYL